MLRKLNMCALILNLFQSLRIESFLFEPFLIDLCHDFQFILHSSLLCSFWFSNAMLKIFYVISLQEKLKSLWEAEKLALVQSKDFAEKKCSEIDEQVSCQMFLLSLFFLY